MHESALKAIVESIPKLIEYGPSEPSWALLQSLGITEAEAEEVLTLINDAYARVSLYASGLKPEQCSGELDESPIFNEAVRIFLQMNESLIVMVTLSVKNFDALEAFEKEAAVIMASHGAVMIKAFESRREYDGSGEEIHIIEFPTPAAFEAYRTDERLFELSELHEQAIIDMDLKVSQTTKQYS
jgi:hypothetical protein